MNDRAAITISILVLLATFIVAFVIGAWRDQSAFAESSRLFEAQASSYLGAITETERNDLLQENFRQVRNHFSSLREDGLFAEYAIEKSGTLVEQSERFAQLREAPDYLLTSVPMEFTKGSVPWGSVKFLTSRAELRKTSGSLRSTLLYASLGMALVSVIAVSFLLWSFWRSGYFLSSYVEARLRETTVPTNRLAHWLWEPLLTVTTSVVANFKRAAVELESVRVESEIGLLASQVAHDIRSPLSALSFAISGGALEGERGDVAKNAVSRINRIASDLLVKAKTIRTGQRLNSSGAAPVKTADLIEAVVEEKRLQLKVSPEIRIECEVKSASSVQVAVDRTEFERAISNLLNNSIEALDGIGLIKITQQVNSESLTVSILDSGRGIQADVLGTLGVVGVSYGKSGETGTGLGLAHARAVVENAGGKFLIQSKFGEGTLVTLSFPIAGSLAHDR